ncbi:podoplanin isoform X2 [Halichoerus grypus]|uniref:podoplanin isoform X2 n=1 Tax=Phoca vitulina TaxID=9720 RepID=UPI001395D15C|nr:podoplanin isoform X2 [Phoca vitulina]XP_035950156.1 podoplanin isoform X2 [Halichoerus grypus]
MLTPRKVSYCKVCSSASAGEGSLGIPPTLGLFCSLNSSPCSPAPLGKGLWLQSFFIFPQHRNQLLGPKENKSTEKMWKVPVLLLVLGSAWLWDPAEGASTVRPEDDITPGVEDSVVTLGAEDNVMTPGTSEEPYESGLTALVPINTESVTDFHLEDGPTQESTVHAKEESQSTTALNVVTSHSIEKVGEDTETTVEKDGLATVTLVGIIVGVLLAIGFIGGIIIVVARKMSGRP